jgi:ubiquinone/menaquinone biosynthesis C-methylase UbiE
VFGLLGARVTVVDLVEGQLQGDVAAAAHYGYEVVTVCADMRDLSCIGEGGFDLVYQAPSMAYIPDVRPVYAEVFRVLKQRGCIEYASPIRRQSLWTGILGMEKDTESRSRILRELNKMRKME